MKIFQIIKKNKPSHCHHSWDSGKSSNTLLPFYSHAAVIEIIESGHSSVSYHQTQRTTIICSDPIILSSCSTDQKNYLFLYLRPFTFWIIKPMCVVRNLTWSICLFLLYLCFSSHWNSPISFTIVLTIRLVHVYYMKSQTVKLDLLGETAAPPLLPLLLPRGELCQLSDLPSLNLLSSFQTPSLLL